MKRLLIFSFVLFAALSLWADADLKSGSLKELKDANARILITWDYSDMLIEDMEPEAYLKEKGPDWERDYPAEVTAGESAFTVYFNKKNKKYALITDDEDAANYEMVIHVKKFHYGSTGAAIVLGGWARGASIEGTVDVVDRANKKVVATIEYDCAGKSAYSSEARRMLALEDLAQDLAKLVSKAK